MIAAGARLGSYEVLAPLGAGGMGEVWRARDTRLGRDVALKVLPEALATDADRLARFEREARAAAALNHPNIVTLYAIEEAAGTRFLTMELVEGRTLGDLVAPGGLLLPQVLDVATALADALATAHVRGIVHRDLKPANVMVTREGRVKVLDFGLAKLAETATAAAAHVETMPALHSDPGHVLGTAPYMAPEQVRGEPADARSDLFALGVVLYELVAGRRPFEGPSPADVSSAILRDAPPPLATLRPGTPPDLARIVGRCLEKAPADRYQGAAELHNELRLLRRKLELAPGQADPGATQGTASIAVLPFVNRSASADDEYFADGLADELISVLAKIRGLRVAARSSAFTFKGRRATVAEVGRALNVAAVLEGSVRKAGNRVRISVQLVKVDDGFDLWSETYDRTLDDIFAVQDEIAQSVVKELRATLLGKEDDSEARGEARSDVARASLGRATDPEAHRLWLQGRFWIDRATAEETQKGIAALEQALRIDPRFALAWVDLARAYLNSRGYGWLPPMESSQKARAAARHALEAEPNLAEGHAILSNIELTEHHDLAAAEVSLRRASELAPGSAAVLRQAALLALIAARLDDAIALYDKALVLDPLSPALQFNRGLALIAADRFAEAEQTFRLAEELAPRGRGRLSAIALSLVGLGRLEEARAVFQAEPDELMRLYAGALVEHAAGRRAQSDASLAELSDRFGDHAAVQIAMVRAQRGETEQAFAWLDRALAQNDGGLIEIRYQRWFRPLHGDPRWTALLRRVGLEE